MTDEAVTLAEAVNVLAAPTPGTWKQDSAVLVTATQQLRNGRGKWEDKTRVKNRLTLQRGTYPRSSHSYETSGGPLPQPRHPSHRI